ncbi:MAG: hypothetical protein AB1797_05550 [bacterium]
MEIFGVAITLLSIVLAYLAWSNGKWMKENLKTQTEMLSKQGEMLSKQGEILGGIKDLIVEEARLTRELIEREAQATRELVARLAVR